MELGHQRVKTLNNSQKTPLHLTFAYVLQPSILGVTQSYSMLAILLCVGTSDA